MRRAGLRSIIGVVLFVALAAPALAQRTTGEIFGIVTDESGAVLPGVSVTLQGATVSGTLAYQVNLSTRQLALTWSDSNKLSPPVKLVQYTLLAVK